MADYPTQTGAFLSTLSTQELNDVAVGFPVDTEADLTLTITKFNMLVQTGALSGFVLQQALLQILGYFNAHAEAVPAPTSVYAGAAGSTTRYYAAIARYPLVPGPGLGTIGAQMFLPGAPPEGRSPGVNSGAVNPVSVISGGASGRKVRYSPLGARTTVAATGVLLGGANTVTITAPAASTVTTAAGTTPTFDIVACDASGNVLYWVALSVAAGATAVDNGANVLLPYNVFNGVNAAGAKTAYAEAIVGPTSGAALYAPPTSMLEAGVY